MSEKKAIVAIEEPTTEITPMSLIQQAQAGNASVEQMSQLLDLQMRWEANEARKAFNVAMSKFRNEAPNIRKTRKAHNSMYAGLSESVSAVKPLLAKYGLSHRWSTAQEGGKITVTCTVSHIDGHSESTSLTAESDKSGSKNIIQAIGSTITYLERYSLYAILGLASTDQDDDGSAAGQSEAYISEEQAATIYELIDEIGVDEKKFLGFMSAHSIEEISAWQYDKAIAALNKKRGAK